MGMGEVRREEGVDGREQRVVYGRQGKASMARQGKNGKSGDWAVSKICPLLLVRMGRVFVV